MAPNMPIDEEKGEAGFQTASAENDSTGGESPTGTPTSNKSFSSVWPLVNPVARLKSLRLARQQTKDSAQPDTSTLASEEEDDSDIVVRRVHKMPLGYPRLATFMDSEGIFSVYRRFGYIQSRLLLEKQDDLRQLEQRLDELDQLDEEEYGPGALQTRELAEGEEPSPQQKILKEMETKYLEYSQLLQASQALTAFNKPTSSEYQSVRNWLDHAQPVLEPERRFIDCKEDLVTLRTGQEHDWLAAAVEGTIRRLRCKPIQWMFRSKETCLKSNGCHGEFYFTRARIEACVNTIITVMILLLLVVPIYILYHLTSNANSAAATYTDDNGTGVLNLTSSTNNNTAAICIGVLLISTLAFSATLSLFTSARRHEILGASAAYCAGLVVFIGTGVAG